MKTVYNVSLVEFICNYLSVSPYYHPEISSYVNYTLIMGLAALYEKEHEDSFVATTPDDIRWMYTATNTKFRKEDNIFVVSPGCQDYVKAFKNDNIIDWFKDHLNMSYEEIYTALDCMYILK